MRSSIYREGTYCLSLCHVDVIVERLRRYDRSLLEVITWYLPPSPWNWGFHFVVNGTELMFA